MPPRQDAPAPVAVSAPPVPQEPATAVVAGTPAPQAVTGSPREIYQGLRTKREVLMNQKDRLQEERQQLADQLRSGSLVGADKEGLEQQLAAVDQRIAQISIDIQEANAEVATAAAVPGALAPSPSDGVDEGEVLAIGLVVSAVLLFPVFVAWARRLWRKAAVVPVVPPELVDRMGNLERNLDTVALEIERIGEGQRFVTQLLAQKADARREALPEPRRDA